jgi:hypothetical protein
MRIGDKVRFIHETGGGVVTGFRGKDIVLVEGEDGFELPMPLSECVAIDTNEYNFEKKSVAPKSEASKTQQNYASRPQPAKKEVEEDEPVVTFRKRERPEGERLNIHLAYMPMDAKSLSNSRFEAYLINDSNYSVYYTYSAAEGNCWRMRGTGLLAPDSKCFIEEFGREELNSMERVCVQLLPFKDDRNFVLKAAMNIERRIDTVKFYKLHLFKENPFFEADALMYDIVVDDKPVKEIFADAAEMQRAIMEKKRVDTAPKASPAQPKLQKGSDILEVDLHADTLLETTAGMNSFDILNYQLGVVRKTLDEYIKEKNKRIVFIHGKGEGVLRNAIAQELKRKYPRCVSQDASFQKYGFGATMVIIK